MVAAAAKAYRDDFAKSAGERDGMRGRLEAELAGIERKSARLLQLVEDGHADPAVTGPRLNELSQQKRRLASELAVRPNDTPEIVIRDGGQSYRELVEDLQTQLSEGGDGAGEACALVRGLISRITVRPATDDEDQVLEVEAGFTPKGVRTDQYCEVGCGGWI